MVQAYKNEPNVVFRDLYEEFPDFDVLPGDERKMLYAAGTIIFHLPLIWFGIPPLLKLWIDEVFERKWLRGIKSDNPLYGKDVYVVTTIESDFRPVVFREDLFRFDVKVFLKPLTECIEGCNMKLKRIITVDNSDKISFQELEKYYMEIKNIIQDK